MDSFKLVSSFSPMGDQPEAIDELIAGIENGTKVDVYHIPENSDGSQAEPEFVCKASVKNGEVTFTAESFSVYVIVQGPEPYEVDPEVIQSLSELADACDPGSDSYEIFQEA